MIERLTIRRLHDRIGITANTPGYGVAFGPLSRAALNARFSNPAPRSVTDSELAAAALRLGVPVKHIRGIRKVEAPRGPFDDQGRPAILYERHKFRAHTIPPGRFDKSDPGLSGPPYGAGGYGKFSVQYERLAAACALDPEAAFRACSWGAFQVLGENAEDLGYPSAFDMALSLVTGEAAHLETFVRYVEANKLVDELQACRPGDPGSCIPFVSRYNGPGFRDFDYHVKLAAAIS